MTNRLIMDIIWNCEKYTMNTNVGRKQKKEENYFLKKTTTSRIVDFNLSI